MNNSIRESIRKHIISEIENAIDNYDFDWAIEEAMDPSELKEEIEEAIFDDLCMNGSGYAGKIIENIIEEEVPRYVRKVFDNI